MFRKRNNQCQSFKNWGLQSNVNGELVSGGCIMVDLANKYGTPLHIVNEDRLCSTVQSFTQAVKAGYPGKCSVHYAFKCNPVPGIISMIKARGLKAEVMSEFELRLALKMDYSGEEIIVNGPFKPERFLSLCLQNQVRFIVIDSLSELEMLTRLCESIHATCGVLVRINPDIIPKGMNSGSATGSRKGCAFGLDLKSDEVAKALRLIRNSERVHFYGYHFHIGTGISRPDDYHRTLNGLKQLVAETKSKDFKIKVFDIGGGIASATSREMTTKEMLLYQGWEKLPKGITFKKTHQFFDFISRITEGMKVLFDGEDLPELIIEPGRCITSSSQYLLLTVHQVKHRRGVKKWLITDGGIGTVSMPTYYEYHEVFLCNDISRPRSEKVTITGPGCFAADIVYRNKPMPTVKPGELLAIMDSGAYFTSWESNFSHPRPAIVSVKNGKHRLIRKRESFEEMTDRDFFEPSQTKNHLLHHAHL